MHYSDAITRNQTHTILDPKSGQIDSGSTGCTPEKVQISSLTSTMEFRDSCVAGIITPCS